MDLTHEFCRRRRLALGLSQRELAHRAGIPQASLSLYESGKRGLSGAARDRLKKCLAVRPAVLLDKHRDAVKQVAKEHHLRGLRVFGSVAKNWDTPDSDIDLIVELDGNDDLVTRVWDFEHAVEELLTTNVDILIADPDRQVNDAQKVIEEEALEL